MAQQSVPYTPWEPDQALFGGQQTTEALNVLPSKRGYRPLQAFEAVPGVENVPAAVVGAISVRDSAGNARTFVGTGTNLYYLTSGTWTSKGSGYTLAASDGWSFAQYGDSLVATGYADNPVLSSLASGSVGSFSTITDAPRARYAAVIKDFVFLGCLAGDEAAIQWSAFDDPTDWPTPGTTEAQTKQSDKQVFVGGQNRGFISGWAGVDGLIFMETAIYRATYVGPPLVFQFDPIEKQRGLVAPRSPVVAAGKCYYLTQDGWFVTDGGTCAPFGVERVDQWFSDTVNRGRISEVRGALDAVNRVIVWTFPSRTCPAGYHDSMLIYSYSLDQWSHASMDAEFILEDRPSGVTLEGLDAVADLDSLPYSLDDPSLQGGALSLSVFCPTHCLRRSIGMNLAATIDTPEIGGSRLFVQGVRPLVDGDAPSASLLTRDLLSQEATETATQSPSAFDGVCYFHNSTRYVRARVTTEADASWTHATGCEIIYEPEGTP